MDNHKTRFSYTEGWLSIGINVVLFILKYTVGILYGSIAIIADAWHSLSDSITSIIIILSTRISKKPPDKEHPFGHERINLIASIIIGVLLFTVAFNFFESSLKKLISKQGATYGIWAILVIIVSILVKEGLARYAFFTFRKTGLEMLKADAWHHRSDALSSLIVLIGILLGRFFWWIDGILGIIISIIIMYTAYEVFKESIGPILGESPDEELIKYVKRICNEVSDIGNLHAHHFHIHNYGTHKELTFHLVFPKDMSIEDCHRIATSIEKRIKKELNIDTTIHLESIDVII